MPNFKSYRKESPSKTFPMEDYSILSTSTMKEIKNSFEQRFFAFKVNF